MAEPEVASRRDRLSGGPGLPQRREWLVRLFQWYASRYVRKHFHAVRLSRTGTPFPPPGDDPLLIVLNHPAWWDPMICTVLSRLMADRAHFAAIGAEAIKRYAFFRKLGFVGVDTKSLRGAAAFIRNGTTILAEPKRVFWVTAQGRFTDVRVRPLALQAGVGHLAARVPRAVVLPVAFEYTFWTERTPEALARIGEPIRSAADAGRSGKEWTAIIEESLTNNLDALAAEAATRDPAKFTTLLSGKAGVGGVYDSWRRFKAAIRGEKFDPAHDAGSRGDDA